VPQLPGAAAPLVLPARPEPVAFAPSQTALIVVDMQNAYASLGGYVDSAGFDISGAQGTIAQIEGPLPRRERPASCRSTCRTAGTRSTSKPGAPARPTGTSRTP
jgi:nicotinamidase-related amidase